MATKESAPRLIKKPVFQRATTYPVAHRSMGIAIGDLNGDDRADFVVPSFVDDNGGLGQISVLIANADGTYQTPVNYFSGGGAAWTAVIADFNRDGKPDVAESGVGPENINILLGNGDGTLQSPVGYPAGDFAGLDDDFDLYASGGRPMVVGDFNGDNLLDIAFSNGSGGAGVILGHGDGTFSPPLLFPVGTGFALGVAVADMNRDGKLDLVFANQCLDPACSVGSAIILIGKGDGTFQAGASYSAGAPFAMAVAVGDLNGDGIPDVALGGWGISHTMSALLGNSDGTLATAKVYSAGVGGDLKTSTVAIADFNHDGKSDVAVLNYCDVCDAVFSVFSGKGNGSFVTRPQQYELFLQHAEGFAVADLNHDERPDAVVSGVFGGINILLSNKNGTLQAAPSFATGGSQPSSVVAGDFNLDGKDDLAVANTFGGIGVLLGNGRGSFEPPLNSFGDEAGFLIGAGDFNGDGNPDLILSGGDLNGSYEISVLLGDGRGRFKRQFAYPTPLVSSAIASTDCNGDGKLDLVIAPGIAAGSGAAVFLGNGDGTFQAPMDYGSGLQGTVATTADFNEDGKPDLALSSPLQVLLGNGDGTFQPPVVYSANGGSGLLAVDLNTDGILDLVNGSEIFFGLGDGTFQQPVTYPVNGIPVAADFNGDGVMDVAFPGNMLLGTGGGSFNVVTSYLYSASFSQVGDFNHDGRPDLAGTAINSGVTTLLLNITPDFHFATSTNLSSSRNPAKVGEKITLSAHINSAFPGRVTGTVTFYDGDHAMSTAVVKDGEASLSTSSRIVGTHSITAVYSGDGRHLPSTSAILQQKIIAQDTP